MIEIYPEMVFHLINEYPCDVFVVCLEFFSGQLSFLLILKKPSYKCCLCCVFLGINEFIRDAVQQKNSSYAGMEGLPDTILLGLLNS